MIFYLEVENHTGSTLHVGALYDMQFSDIFPATDCFKEKKKYFKSRKWLHHFEQQKKSSWFQFLSLEPIYNHILQTVYKTVQ